jgi:hypothetical protein
MQYIHPSPFAEASLHFRIQAQWETPPCGAEPRIELGPALKQADALIMMKNTFSCFARQIVLQLTLIIF